MGKPWETPSYHPGFSSGTGHQADPDRAAGPGDLQELYWINVSSSNVDAISWNEGAKYKLWVRFKDQGKGAAVYAYDAPEDVYDEMFGASSMGRFVHHVLKRYPVVRVY